jgi:hypothetical protein
MRQLSNEEINKLKLLTENSVEFTLIEPTATGLDKSILDATATVRTYLQDKHIHNYDLQKQGIDHKILIKSSLIEPQRLIPSAASLYRPETKKGDPRIWFKGLNAYANPNDILAIIEYDKQLFVLDITTLDIAALVHGKLSNPLKDLIKVVRQTSRRVADELLALLKGVAARGPVPAMLKADTAVGRTLEHLLNISINSSKLPDYRGIELKSFRDTNKNRKNLFAQVPDWALSKFKSSSQILEHLGYARGENRKLYCTVSTLVKNSQGLQLKLDKSGFLYENSDQQKIGDFVVWKLETLYARLLEKHNETFWIAADSIMIKGVEHFQYKKVLHTKKPITAQFDVLLGKGIITLDHLIKLDAKTNRVVEKGPLFKIKPDAVGSLFPPSQVYDLT